MISKLLAVYLLVFVNLMATVSILMWPLIGYGYAGAAYTIVLLCFAMKTLNKEL